MKKQINKLHIDAKEVAQCAYGENAWQKPASLFATNTKDPLALHRFKVIAGSAPSYNNWCEIDRLLQTMTHIVAGFEINAPKSKYFFALGSKHGNCCGAGYSTSKSSALKQMINGDALAIMGGLVMLNAHITKVEANILSSYATSGSKRILDGVIAASFDSEAIDILSRKSGKCRLIANPALAALSKKSLDTQTRLRMVRGGFLQQPNYTFIPDLKDPIVKTYGPKNQKVILDLIFGWAIGSTSNSNTITLVKSGTMLANAVGQQDRVGAAKLAIMRATRGGHDVKDAVAYSDSFFPFADGPQVLIDAGISAIFTTSGSVRDQDTIDLCQKSGITLAMIPDSIGRGFFGH